jgi:hypothetical protein
METYDMAKEPLTTLGKIVDEVRSDIFRLDEELGLFQMIGANAVDINEGGFGFFFGRIQIILQDQIILLLFKIFEKPDDFPLMSIPAIEKLITEYSDSFAQIESKSETALALLARLGCKGIAEDNSITEVFPKYWRNRFGSMRSVRRKIGTLRSKVSAHHEQVEANLLPDVSLSEVKALLEQAKLFLSVVEATYLDIVTTDYEGHYIVTSESKTASLILRNLLVKANVIDARKGREIARTLFSE